jgi:hypothetical protein
MLAALGPARGAAGVQQEQRRLGGHGHRVDYRSPVVSQDLVGEEVPAAGHRALRRVLAGVAPPDEHLLDLGALRAGSLDRLVGFDLVVDQLPVAV